MRPFGRMLWEENARAIVSRNRDRAEGDGLHKPTPTIACWRHRRDADRAIRARALPRLPMRRRRQLCPVQRPRCTVRHHRAPSPPLTAWTPSSTPRNLPFGGFKESEIAAFLRRVELTGLASELSRE